MVKLRMRRAGRKFEAIYHIVATDARAPRDGRFIEEIGLYNPQTKQITLNDEARTRWLKNGAQPSDTVRALFAKYDATKSESATASRQIAAKPRRKTPKKVAASS